MGSLDGRVALVTGASRGIGAAIALRLAGEGARIAAVARTAEPDPRYHGSLADTVAAIRAAGGCAVPIAADLSKAADRERAVDEAQATLGPVEILVNNAAVTMFSPIEEFTEKRFRLMTEVQVWAPYHLTQLVLPGMYERGEGWILNISSRASEHPPGPPYEPIYLKGFSVYGMCKAALERFTSAVASEGYERGVWANSLSPLDNVETSGAGAHDLVSDWALEDVSVMAEAALALVEGNLTARIAISQHLLAELGRTPLIA